MLMKINICYYNIHTPYFILNKSRLRHWMSEIPQTAFKDSVITINQTRHSAGGPVEHNVSPGNKSTQKLTTFLNKRPKANSTIK